MRATHEQHPTLDRRSFLATLATVAGAALAYGAEGCGPPPRVMAPPGLEPLEPTNTAPATAQPDRIVFASGQAEGYAWVHGRGVVDAPLAAVWTALRNPDACVNRREVSSWTVTRNTEPAYRSSFVVHNVVNAVITVEFDVSWRQDITDGTEAAPTKVAARFEKTMGSDVISLMRGSLLVSQRAAGGCDLELIEHLDALGRGAETAQSFMQDLFDSLVALAHQRPLPTYR